MQFLAGDLHRCHLESTEFEEFEHVFANNSRLKIATDMDVVSLCLSCRDASTGMPHDLLRAACDLDLRSNTDLIFQGHLVYALTRIA